MPQVLAAVGVGRDPYVQSGAEMIAVRK